MNHSEFAIGEAFWCGGRLWRCTDKGTRVITAIRLDHICITSVIAENGQVLGLETLDRTEAEAVGWFKGPPYAVSEVVFDENDMEGCSPDVIQNR